MHNFIESEYFNLYIASTPAIDKFSNEDYVEYLKKDDNEFRVVVADGVSSSLMGGDWAKILVKNVIKSSESGDDFEKFFEIAVDEFNTLISQKKSNGSRLLTEKIKRDKYGSSTILSCDIKSNYITCYFIGDTLVYQLNPSENMIKPLRNNHHNLLKKTIPDQIISNKEVERPNFKEIKNHESLQEHLFFLVTDAMAEFIYHKDRDFANELLFSIKNKKFDEFIQENRLKASNMGGIRDDDSTIVIIEYK